MKIDGHCHCGEITFQAEVDPDALDIICHCTESQNALPNGISRQHPGTGQAFRATERHTQDLYQDGRKRQQTPSRLLRQLRHSDLCLCGGQPAELWLACRDNYAARGLLTEATRLAAICAALGGCARRCARDRERVDRLNRDYFTQVQLRLTPLPPTRYSATDLDEDPSMGGQASASEKAHGINCDGYAL